MQVPVLITFKDLVGFKALITGHVPYAEYARNAVTVIRAILLFSITSCLRMDCRYRVGMELLKG
jgi:hypothetical protein